MDKNQIKKDFGEFIDSIPEDNLGYKQEVVHKNLFYVQFFNKQEEADDLVEIEGSKQ